MIASSDKGIRRGYLDSDCGQLHYRVCGQREAPLILLLHQTPSSSAMYENLMPLLAENFYTLAVDTPGFGNSDSLSGEVSIAEFSRVIHGAVSAAFDRPCFVFGHHTGASIAIQLAHDFSDFVRGLALSGPPLLTEKQKRELPQAAATLQPEESGAHWLAMWQRLRAKDSDADLALSQRETLLAFACGENYAQSYCAVVAQGVSAQLAAIDCPTLLFAGDRDVLAGAVAPAAQLLRHGRIGRLDVSAGTYVCDCHAAVVAHLLSDFFTEVGVEHLGDSRDEMNMDVSPWT